MGQPAALGLTIVCPCPRLGRRSERRFYVVDARLFDVLHLGSDCRDLHPECIGGRCVSCLPLAQLGGKMIGAYFRVAVRLGGSR
jgi:hypothetical protein